MQLGREFDCPEGREECDRVVRVVHQVVRVVHQVVRVVHQV